MVGEVLPVAKIRKPPDVSEPDSKSKTGEEELDGVVPAASVLVHRRVFTEIVVRDVLQSVTLSQAGLCLQKIKFKRWQTFIKYSILLKVSCEAVLIIIRRHILKTNLTVLMRAVTGQQCVSAHA